MSTDSRAGEQREGVSGSLQSVRAVSFDLDDTLWHCAPVIARADAALFDWLQTHTPRIVDKHSPESLQRYQSAIREQFPELQRCVTTIRLTGLRQLFLEHEYADSLAEQAFETFYRVRSEVELFDGTLEMLQQLRSHYRLAAISNGNADLDLIGISRYFDSIHAANMETAPKPEPDMFNDCLRQLDIPSQALLHVGDNPLADVVGGHNAGVQTLWFNPYNEPWPARLPSPHFQARTLSDIVRLLVP